MPTTQNASIWTESSRETQSVITPGTTPPTTQLMELTKETEVPIVNAVEFQSTVIYGVTSYEDSSSITQANLDSPSNQTKAEHFILSTITFEINQSPYESDDVSQSTIDSVTYRNRETSVTTQSPENTDMRNSSVTPNAIPPTDSPATLLSATSEVNEDSIRTSSTTSEHRSITISGTDDFITLQTRNKFESSQTEDKTFQPTKFLDVVSVTSEEHNTSTRSPDIIASNITIDPSQNQNTVHIKINCSGSLCRNEGNLQSNLKNVSEVAGLDLSGSQIESLPGHFLSMLQQLTFLSLENCSVKHVKHNAFTHLTELKTLKMNENNIVTLPDGVFYNQRKLEILDLGENPFKFIRVQTLIGLESLTELRLTGCKLELLDPFSFRSLNHIQVVQMDLKLLQQFKATILDPGSFPNFTNSPVIIPEGSSSLPCDKSTCWLQENQNRNQGVKVHFLFEGELIRPNCSESADRKWDEVDLHCSETGKKYCEHKLLSINFPD